MIFDNSRNSTVYFSIHSGIKIALEYIQNNNLNSLEIGKYEILGDKVFLLIQSYDTKDQQECIWEAHKKYLDIHYMIEGSELIGIANIEKMKVTTQYDEKDDYWLFSGDQDFLTLEEGMFTIFFPQDVHMTSLKIKESKLVKKAVIKILIN